MDQADSVHSTPPTNTSANDDAQSPVKPPTEAQDSLYLPTDVSPEEAFHAIGRLRQEAQDEIDRLLAFLDQTDGDPDLEPSLAGYSPGMDDREAEPESDEPALGWTEMETRNGRYPEINEVHEGEPSLGSLDRMADQTRAWGSIDPACVSDCELDDSDHEESDAPEDGGDAEPNVDDEPGADAEPSFGWSDEEAARGRYPSLMGSQVPS